MVKGEQVLFAEELMIPPASLRLDRRRNANIEMGDEDNGAWAGVGRG